MSHSVQLQRRVRNQLKFFGLSHKVFEIHGTKKKIAQKFIAHTRTNATTKLALRIIII